MGEFVFIALGLWVVVVPVAVLALGLGFSGARERRARAERLRRVGVCSSSHARRGPSHRSSLRRRPRLRNSNS